MHSEIERRTANVVDVMDVNGIRRTLAGDLAKSGDEEAVKFAGELELDHRPITVAVEVVVAGAQAHLAEHATATMTRVKTSYRSKVESGYPQDFVGAEPLESPKQFIRSSGGQHEGRRTALRTAYDGEVAESKNGLLRELKDDTYVPALGTISDERLGDLVRDEVGRIRFGIGEAVTAVTELLPRQRRGRLGGFAVRSSRRVGESTEGGQSVTLGEAVNGLRELLTAARKANGLLPEFIAKGLYGEVDRMITSELRDRYGELTESALTLLRGEMRRTYEDVVATPEAPRTATRQKARPSPASPVVATSASRPEAMPAQSELQLGEVNSPFPWQSEGEVVNLSLVPGSHPFVFCKAFTELGQEISLRLRQQPRVAERFSTILERIKTVEASGNSLAHTQVNIVRVADFHGLTVYCFSVTEPNAPRLYYVRTKVASFPGLLSGASGRFGEDTPLIVHIAEVDKQNQLKIYRDFGMRRRVAREYGVGSI